VSSDWRLKWRFTRIYFPICQLKFINTVEIEVKFLHKYIASAFKCTQAETYLYIAMEDATVFRNSILYVENPFRQIHILSSRFNKPRTPHTLSSTNLKSKYTGESEDDLENELLFCKRSSDQLIVLRSSSGADPSAEAKNFRIQLAYRIYCYAQNGHEGDCPSDEEERWNDVY
jgi:hypothetical protein